MAFRWVYSTEVFDEDRSVTIKTAFRFRDITNQFTLCYADSVVTFEFEVKCDVVLPSMESLSAAQPPHSL
jgi:hypothetical protein